MLVCAASAVAMILSEQLFYSTGETTPWRPDPARLAAGILTGMGFLGAGSIIRQDNVIRGVTTAAVLWFVTVLGLAFGAGYLKLGLMGMIVAIIILFILPYLESYVKNDWYATVVVTVDMKGASDEELRKKIEGTGIKIKTIDFDYNLDTQKKILRCEVKFKKQNLFMLSQHVVQSLLKEQGVSHVRWT